ncbi:TetR/AcrR family transcriptional regulator [Microbispora amethystogenes]|uniref:TetR/AcrR family transcriptional regulator n=1 Tax=Microbispora amethystogenes TaxID=1427754 RepID=UPI0033EFDBB3
MRALTRKGAATRQRILEGAAALIRENGVADTTLDDVLAGTATSKSQLFHYFPGGREELLLAVARLEADRVLEDQRPQLGDLTSWPAWQAWRDKVVDRYRRQGRLCPLNSVTSHLGSRTPGARAVVTELMRSWQAEIAAGVRHMRDTGEIGPDVDPDRAAAALLAGIQGGVLIQMSTGETTHLEAALDMGLAHLRAGGARAGKVADGL